MALMNNLSTLRATHGLTQAELAAQVGVSRKTINTVENRVFIPSTELALKIARALDTPFEDVFFLQETRSQDQTPQDESRPKK